MQLIAPAQESTSRFASRPTALFSFQTIDSTLILRAFAIIAVVISHFGGPEMPGGFAYLLALSGYNFVRFTMPKFNGNADNFATAYTGYLRKLILPTVLYMLAVFVLLGRFHPFSLLFLSNLKGPGYAEGLSYWFLDVLLQIYFVFGVALSFKAVRRRLLHNSFEFFVAMTAMAFVMRLVSMMMFDTSELLNRLPHLLLFTFALGGAIASSTTMQRRVVATALLLICAVPLLVLPDSDDFVMLLIGGIANLWINEVRLPQIAIVVTTRVALGSLFIYLSHFQARTLLSAVMADPNPLLATGFALVVGVVLSSLWKNRAVLIGRLTGYLPVG